MGRLREAVEAADNRKRAVLPGANGLIFAEGDFQDRAVLSGFDIDYDELVEIALRAGRFFTAACLTGQADLQTLFASAWVDALLIGLLAGKAASEN